MAAVVARRLPFMNVKITNIHFDDFGAASSPQRGAEVDTLSKAFNVSASQKKSHEELFSEAVADLVLEVRARVCTWGGGEVALCAWEFYHRERGE